MNARAWLLAAIMVGCAKPHAAPRGIHPPPHPTRKAGAPPAKPSLPEVAIAIAVPDEAVRLTFSPAPAFEGGDDDAIAEALPKKQRAAFEADTAAYLKLRKQLGDESKEGGAAQSFTDAIYKRWEVMNEGPEGAARDLAVATLWARRSEIRFLPVYVVPNAGPYAELRKDGPVDLGALEAADRFDHDAKMHFEAAKAASVATHPLGFLARYGLAREHWLAGRVTAARDELDALYGAAPARAKPEIALRLGLLWAVGTKADYARAATSFRAALDPLPPGLRRVDVLRALMLSEYRAGRFVEAFAAATQALDAYSTRALESPTTVLTPNGEIRIAADCIERLGGTNKTSWDGVSPRARAAIVAVLAARFYVRANLDAARAAAEEALKDEPNCTAHSVLKALGEDSGPCETPYGIPMGYGWSHRSELPPEDRVERLAMDGPPMGAERTVHSLVRLCLEPSAWRIAPQTKPELDVHVAVFADGVRDVKAELFAGIEVPELVTCVEKMAPVILRGSRNSIRATVGLFAAEKP